MFDGSDPTSFAHCASVYKARLGLGPGGGAQPRGWQTSEPSPHVPLLHSTIIWMDRPPACSSPPRLTCQKVSSHQACHQLSSAAGTGCLPPPHSPALAGPSPALTSSPGLPPWLHSRGYPHHSLGDRVSWLILGLKPCLLSGVQVSGQAAGTRAAVGGGGPSMAQNFRRVCGSELQRGPVAPRAVLGTAPQPGL
jgi:hypothetical protein